MRHFGVKLQMWWRRGDGRRGRREGRRRGRWRKRGRRKGRKRGRGTVHLLMDFCPVVSLGLPM